MTDELMPGVYLVTPDPAPAEPEAVGDWWDYAPVECDASELPY